jgi:hypothetical protein
MAMLYRDRDQLRDLLFSNEPVASPRHAPADGEVHPVRAHVREILRKIPLRKLDQAQQDA